MLPYLFKCLIVIREKQESPDFIRPLKYFYSTLLLLKNKLYLLKVLTINNSLTEDTNIFLLSLDYNFELVTYF